MNYSIITCTYNAEKYINQYMECISKINYKDFDNTAKTTKSDVTPKIKLTEVKQEVPKTEPTQDNTKAPEELPKTGAPMLVGFVAIASIATIAFAIKSKKIDF